MKKRAFGLFISSLLVLVGCDTLPREGVLENNNTNINAGNTAADKGKRTEFYSLETASNPFTDDFSMSGLLLRMDLMTKWSNGRDEKVEDFSEFKFYFTCRDGSSHSRYYAYINIPFDTKVTEAFEIMKQQEGVTSIDRWFKVKMVDEKYNQSFEQNFYYDDYLPNCPEEENFPTINDRWNMPIYDGKGIQYYLYNETSNNLYSFLDQTLVKIYGTNQEETLAYFAALKNDGFIMYDDSNSQRKLFYKPVSDYSIVLMVVLDVMSKNVFDLEDYDTVTLWISELPNATNTTKVSTLSDELVALGLPTLTNSQIEYTYEHRQDSDMLFVYHFTYNDYQKILENFVQNGFCVCEYNNIIYYEKNGLKIIRHGRYDSPYLCFEILNRN